MANKWNPGCCTCGGDPPCSCTVGRDFSGCRPCLEVAYGTRRNIDTVTWTITGTPTVYQNRQGGLPYVPLNGNSPSINGTYIVPCGTRQEWWHCAHVGTRTFGGTEYYYYALGVTFRWSVDRIPDVFIESTYFSNLTGVNPYPTLTVGARPTINPNYATMDVDHDFSGDLADWLYELGGSCGTECNVPTTRWQCPAPYPALVSRTIVYAFPADKHNHVEVDDLTVTCAAALV